MPPHFLPSLRALLLFVAILVASVSAQAHCRPPACSLYGELPITAPERDYLTHATESVHIPAGARAGLDRAKLRYILAPREVRPAEVLAQFLQGASEPGEKAPLSFEQSQDDYRGKTFYALLNITAEEGAYIVVPLTGMARSTIWRLDGQAMKVAHEGGTDLGLANKVNAPAALVTAASTPTTILIRLDSPLSVYPDFHLFSQTSYVDWQRSLLSKQGIIVGAVAMGAMFMLYLALTRRDRGRWLYLASQLCVAWWTLARMDAALPVDSEVVQRLSLLFPLFAYFTVAPLALINATRANNPGRRAAWGDAQPLYLIVGLNAGMACLSLAYGLFGNTFGAAQYLVYLMSGTMAVSQGVMLLYAIAARRSGLVDSWPILIGQILCASGFTMILLRQFTSVLDHTNWTHVINVAILSELLFWNYITELLRIRAEKRLLGAKANADRKLDDSYSMLSATNQAILDAMDTAGHTMRNQLSRVEAMIELADEAGARAALAELRKGVRATGEAIRASIDPSKRAMEPAGEILAWRLASLEAGLAKQRITVRVALEDEAAAAVVDEYLMTEVLRELLTNAGRYSPEGGGVSLSLAMVAGTLEITVENAGAIPADRLAILGQEQVSPDTPRNGERSSGSGLYLISRLVRHSGGRFQAASEAGLVRIAIRLPVQLPELQPARHKPAPAVLA